MDGIAVNRPKVLRLHDTQKMFATKPELEDPIALVAWELIKNWKASSPCLD
jgi:hypothetical protein